MTDAAEQPKLLGFSGHHQVPDAAALGDAIRREVVAMKALLGKRMISISGAAVGADLIFLKTCVELRIPVIVILPYPEERFAKDFEDSEEWAMAQQLTSVALARYVAPGIREAPEAYHDVSRIVLEWADAFLFTCRGEQGSAEVVEEARDLGIPSRGIDTLSLTARWENPLDPHRKARHGFHSRADLLEFLDARFSFSSASADFWQPCE